MGFCVESGAEKCESRRFRSAHVKWGCEGQRGSPTWSAALGQRFRASTLLSPEVLGFGTFTGADCTRTNVTLRCSTGMLAVLLCWSSILVEAIPSVGPSAAGTTVMPAPSGTVVAG